MRRNVVAVVAGCGALMALPGLAMAQNGFPDYRQAAADQYPTQPPPAATGGSSGRPRPVHARPATTKRASAKTGTRAKTGARAPVRVSTARLPAATGSLPFTGSDLSGLIVLALILLAAGFLAAAASRATRRRRRRAPA